MLSEALGSDMCLYMSKAQAEPFPHDTLQVMYVEDLYHRVSISFFAVKELVQEPS